MTSVQAITPSTVPQTKRPSSISSKDLDSNKLVEITKSALKLVAEEISKTITNCPNPDIRTTRQEINGKDVSLILPDGSYYTNKKAEYDFDQSRIRTVSNINELKIAIIEMPNKAKTVALIGQEINRSALDRIKQEVGKSGFIGVINFPLSTGASVEEEVAKRRLGTLLLKA